MKPQTRRNRIVSLCAWASLVLLGGLEIIRTHNARFLTLLMIAAALMMLLHEIKGLLEEPN